MIKKTDCVNPDCDSAGRNALQNDDGRHRQFIRLFAQHEHRIYACIAAMVSRWAEADEVMSDTSLALWEMFDQFEEGTDFARWAISIARLRVLRFRQKCSRDHHQFSQEFVEALADTAATEIDVLETRRRALEECLAELPEQSRDLVAACYAAGNTIKSVAEQLGRPVKRVYKTLERVRQTLFDCVQRKASLS